MRAQAADVWKLIGFIQDDLRQTQSKLVELRTMLATLEMPTDRPTYPCPVCGILRPTETQLAEHVENVHAAA